MKHTCSNLITVSLTFCMIFILHRCFDWHWIQENHSLIYQNEDTRESPIDIPTSPIIAYVIQMVCLAVDTRESLFEIYPDENTRESPIDIQIHQPHLFFQWIHRNHLWESPIDVPNEIHMADMILLWELGQTQWAKHFETPY